MIKPNQCVNGFDADAELETVSISLCFVVLNVKSEWLALANAIITTFYSMLVLYT